MTLTFGFQTPRDLLEKLKREAVRLDEEVTDDHFFNFVVTGWSLIDWVKNDSSSSPAVKAAADAMYKDRLVKTCGDLANASKHFVLDKRKPIVTGAESRRGAGLGRCGKGGAGVGEEKIQVRLDDNTVLGCSDLVEGVIDAWERFFSSHGI